jgi:hypothetical protein
MITPVSCATAIVTGLMIGSLAAAASPAATDAAEAPAPADASHTERAGAAPTPSQTPQPAPTWRTRPIFVCGHAVPVIFSDRPCGTSAETKQVEADERCRKLRDERERLDDRMRAGYTAREAARLWNRWREVGAQIYAARC